MSAAAAAANPGSPHLEPGDIESPPDSPPRDDGEEEPGPLNGTMNGALALTGGVPDWEATGDAVTARETALLASLKSSLKQRNAMMDNVDALRADLETEKLRSRQEKDAHGRAQAEVRDLHAQNEQLHEAQTVAADASRREVLRTREMAEKAADLAREVDSLQSEVRRLGADGTAASERAQAAEVQLRQERDTATDEREATDSKVAFVQQQLSQHELLVTKLRHDLEHEQKRSRAAAQQAAEDAHESTARIQAQLDQTRSKLREETAARQSLATAESVMKVRVADLEQQLEQAAARLELTAQATAFAAASTDEQRAAADSQTAVAEKYRKESTERAAELQTVRLSLIAVEQERDEQASELRATKESEETFRQECSKQREEIERLASELEASRDNSEKQAAQVTSPLISCPDPVCV